MKRNHQMARVLALTVLTMWGLARGETPLTGSAYRFADEAYQAYAKGDYRTAMARARDALKLRPDVPRLRKLLEDAQAAEDCKSSSRSPQCAQNPGYDAADAGYKAYAAGDYSGAVVHAREAVRLSPNHEGYRLLLANALDAAGAMDAAITVLQQAMVLFPANAELMAANAALSQRLALQHAQRAYGALQAGRYDDAARLARMAMARHSSEAAYHLLLAQSLAMSGQLAQAEAGLSGLLPDAVHGTDVLILRGLIRQKMQRLDAANHDFDAALRWTDRRAEDREADRLVIVDAALSSGDPHRAMALLTDRSDGASLASEVRLRMARLALLDPVESVLPEPAGLVCDLAASRPRCRAVAGSTPVDPAYRMAEKAYRLFDSADHAAAASMATRAVELAPENQPWRLLLINSLIAAGQMPQADTEATALLALDERDARLWALRGQIRQRLGLNSASLHDYAAALRLGGLPAPQEIGVLVDTGQTVLARQRFAAALAGGELKQLQDLDVAYLAVRVGDDATALAVFEMADSANRLPPEALPSAAYAAQRLHQDPLAIGFFKRTVDAARAQKLKLGLQQLFDTRRAIGDLDRRWGAYGSVVYRNLEGPLGVGLNVPGGGSQDSLQAGAEAYWRPLGYRNGTYVEFYARVFQTLYARDGSATGSRSTSSAVGARWKPLSFTNLVFAVERVHFASGNNRSDWLMRIAHSAAIGTDLRVDEPAWWTAQSYAEWGRFVHSGQRYALAEVQAGRSHRLDNINTFLVATPHLVWAASYDSAAIGRHAVGAGPGINFRYWFREDEYRAPQSHYDLSLQYRIRLTGDQRGGGALLRFNWLY